MIDKSKTYKTRNGREVRIYATDGSDCTPVHGAIQNPEGWEHAGWNLDGTYHRGIPSPADLIEVKPSFRIERWVNVYRNYVASYETREKALYDRVHDCLATKHVIIEGVVGEDDA